MVEALGRTEQEYLDLAQTFKDRMDEKNKEQMTIKHLYIGHKKQLSQIYGLLRTVQEEMEGTVVDEMLVEWLINECRSICSRILFKSEEMKLGTYDDEQFS